MKNKKIKLIIVILLIIAIGTVVYMNLQKNNTINSSETVEVQTVETGLSTNGAGLTEL
ncbi:hypothetical protein GF340_03185 [Candidatus Peregrinibacteria bacterium]|nr:hypothetical protein [Candidatus Peregrinibacteria bacterium]